MEQYKRTQNINKYKEEKRILLVCTDLGSRGLDVENINIVVNLENSRHLTTHIHRVGRAGRAGH